MVALSLMAMGQSMSSTMEGDDPAQWERHWLHYDMVTDYLPYYAELTDLDSIVDYGVVPEVAVDARGVSLVTLTNDSLTIEWKKRRLQIKYFYLDFIVDKVEYGNLSPIKGWKKTVFYLSGNDRWTDAKATLLATDTRWRMYIQDEESVYFFKGWN